MPIPHNIAFGFLCTVAGAMWILYVGVALHEAGKTEWIKKRLVDLLMILSIAAVTLVFNVLLGSIHTHHR